MQHRWKRNILLMGALILAAPQARSQIASSPPVTSSSTVFGSGATYATDGHLQLQATAGQAACGFTSSNANGSLGFWVPASRQTAHYQTGQTELPDPAGLQIQAWPNPFSATTQLTVRVGNASQSSLMLYDVLGKPIRTLMLPDITDNTPASFPLDAGDLPSGQYTLVLSSGESQSVIPLRLVK